LKPNSEPRLVRKRDIRPRTTAPLRSDSDVGLSVFVVDFFLKGMNGFFFLDSIEPKFPSAHEDAGIISGRASEDEVDMCLASNVIYLLEKPVNPGVHSSKQ
jgi:hypothetical protein